MRWKFWAGRTARVQMVNLAEVGLGRPLGWEDAVRALEGRLEDPAVRAVVQVMLYQLGKARGHELQPGMEAGQRAYWAGGAAAVDETLGWLLMMGRGQGKAEALAELRGVFGEKGGKGNH